MCSNKKITNKEGEPVKASEPLASKPGVVLVTGHPAFLFQNKEDINAKQRTFNG